MKKIISTILGIVAMLSLVLMCAESQDGNVDLIWSGSFMALFLICAKAWEKLNPENEE